MNGGRMARAIGQCALADLMTVPVGDDVVVELRRAAMLLCAVGRTALRGRAIGMGYARRDHMDGLLFYSFASRQRTYADWLDYEELRPHCDPPNEALLEEVEQLLDELSLRAAVSIAVHLAPPGRDHLLSAICDRPDLSTRFARVRARLCALRDLAQQPFDGVRRVDAHLRRGDGETKLALATGVIELLRAAIREAPLDAERHAYILSDVIAFERRLAAWLQVQRARFAALDREELERVGLGGRLLDSTPSLRELAAFLRVAQA